MAHQTTFAQAEFAAKKKTTRREKFLARMKELIPWAKLLAVIEPHYPKGQRGRPPVGLERMLRIYFLQQWHALADEALEDALYDSQALQSFARLDLSVGDKHYDLSMLKGIGHRFERWLKWEADATNATLGIENGWFVGDRKVMREEVWLRAAPASRDERVLDVELIWAPVGEPITLEGAEGKKTTAASHYVSLRARTPSSPRPWGRARKTSPSRACRGLTSRRDLPDGSNPAARPSLSRLTILTFRPNGSRGTTACFASARPA